MLRVEENNKIIIKTFIILFYKVFILGALKLFDACIQLTTRMWLNNVTRVYDICISYKYTIIIPNKVGFEIALGYFASICKHLFVDDVNKNSLCSF